jgi:hypothetical protein
MANPGGLEPPAAGLKVPCPADPGFTLGVRDPAFVRRHCLLLVWCTREVLPLLSDGHRPPPSLLRLTCVTFLVLRRGFEPRMSVCKTDAFGRLANGAW